jgi:hypothetical protein
MKKGNLIFIVLGLGALYYYFNKKSSVTTITPVIPNSPKYPVGLNEGDVVKGTPEDVYVLLGGLAHPVTEHWFVYNINDYSKVKRLDDYIINTLNKGEVLN